MTNLRLNLAAATLLFVAGHAATASAQNAPQPNTPIYKITINVVERTTHAVNYAHRSGATKIDFRGTPLLPAAHGEAKVESKQGYMEVEVEFRDLQSATRYGPEFLTYVLWGITPEGRAKNMGEVILNGTSSKLDVTTELQAFGMIVTAEPYFAVTQPSDVVIMENFVRTDTVGKIEEIEAKYELLKRGQYTTNVTPSDLQAIKLDKNTPLDLYEARNAVRIAGWAGARADAADSYKKASDLLVQAEAYKVKKAGTRSIAMTAREAVQTAEDARLIALEHQDTERTAKERADSAGREAAAKAATGRAEADSAIAQAAAGRAEADRAAAQAQSERTRLDAEAASRRAASDAQALAERTRLNTDIAARDAARDKDAAAAASQLALKTAGEQSEREKQELRMKLSAQLNLILQTRDSARGLIVNMSDVLFDTGQAVLKAGAREKLAKLSGIVLAYPSLELQVEGFTDNVGTDESNQVLSEKRAVAVRDFLVSQGITTAISAKGLGEAQFVATNDTAEGRQQNRRVELIVSGTVIGVVAAGR